jgi:ubiquinone/menaquinone biosynthesis C-methylase UbiE
MLNSFIARPNNYPFRRFFWRNFYNAFASKYAEIDIVFMNYGYLDLSPNAEQLRLNIADEEERYCLQLYHHVAGAVSLEGLDVLEVGCGRGGGASYIKRYLKPKTMTGVDFSRRNIEFCQNHHFVSQLNFTLGDAESLPFNDSLFDAVVNVESSHCYGSCERFFAEVFRVLRPNGNFLFTDFRPKEVVDKTTQQLIDAGFKIIKAEKITPNVLKSMDLQNDRKLKIINQSIPKYLHIFANWFAASAGTPVYEALKDGTLEYVSYTLQK